MRAIHKSKLPQVSREELEEAVKSYLEKGGKITRLDFFEPSSKNLVYTESPLRFVEEDDVQESVIDGFSEF